MGPPAVPSDQPSLFRHISETVQVSFPRTPPPCALLRPRGCFLVTLSGGCAVGLGAWCLAPHCRFYQKFGITFLPRASWSQVTALHLQEGDSVLQPPSPSVPPSVPLRSTGWGGLWSPRLPLVPGPRPYTLQALRVHWAHQRPHSGSPGSPCPEALESQERHVCLCVPDLHQWQSRRPGLSLGRQKTAHKTTCGRATWS